MRFSSLQNLAFPKNPQRDLSPPQSTYPSREIIYIAEAAIPRRTILILILIIRVLRRAITKRPEYISTLLQALLLCFSLWQVRIKQRAGRASPGATLLRTMRNPIFAGNPQPSFPSFLLHYHTLPRHPLSLPVSISLLFLAHSFLCADERCRRISSQVTRLEKSQKKEEHS